jgi:hypothetical protein
LVLVILGAAFWYCCERPFMNKPVRAKTSVALQSTAA